MLSVFSLSDQVGAFTIPLALLGGAAMIALAIYQALRGVDLEDRDGDD